MGGGGEAVEVKGKTYDANSDRVHFILKRETDADAPMGGGGLGIYRGVVATWQKGGKGNAKIVSILARRSSGVKD